MQMQGTPCVSGGACTRRKCTQLHAWADWWGFAFFTFFRLHRRSIISFSCNDVDLIKIFIGFHKIVSYITFPGALLEEATVGDGREWGLGVDRRRESNKEIEKEVEWENISGPLK